MAAALAATIHDFGFRHWKTRPGLVLAHPPIFDYRGRAHASTPGQVVVPYPDEVHEGRAGTAEGFGYRIVYVETALTAPTLARRAPCSCSSAPSPPR